jgi:hypothetical protein
LHLVLYLTDAESILNRQGAVLGRRNRNMSIDGRSAPESVPQYAMEDDWLVLRLMGVVICEVDNCPEGSVWYRRKMVLVASRSLTARQREFVTCEVLGRLAAA